MRDIQEIWEELKSHPDYCHGELWTYYDVCEEINNILDYQLDNCEYDEIFSIVPENLNKDELDYFSDLISDFYQKAYNSFGGPIDEVPERLSIIYHRQNLLENLLK